MATCRRHGCKEPACGTSPYCSLDCLGAAEEQAAEHLGLAICQRRGCKEPASGTSPYCSLDCQDHSENQAAEHPHLEQVQEKAAARVLATIKAAQGQKRNGYAQALGEIQDGHKQSCWIWYVWPCLAKVRTTSRPQFSLPDLDAALQYLKDPVLAGRLEEITEVALEHLRGGVKPVTLFGGSIDAIKFHETVTGFAIAAMEGKDLLHARLFLSVLEALGGNLEKTTMDYIVREVGLRRYYGIATSAELFDMLGEAPPPASHNVTRK